MIDPHDRAHSFLGVTVHSLRMEEWNDLIRDAVRRDHRISILSQNCHGIYLSHHDPEHQRAGAQALVRIDGMSVIAIGRVLGHRLRPEHRVTWNDWWEPLMQFAVRERWKVFYLGSDPETLAAGLAELRRRHVTLEISGHHGYFAAENEDGGDDSVVEEVSRFSPQLLLVGMGMPRQEIWIMRNRQRLACPVVLSCGAAIEYVAGKQTVAPRWMGRMGLEWLHRLFQRPGVMWRRYLWEPWHVGWLTVREFGSRTRDCSGC